MTASARTVTLSVDVDLQPEAVVGFLADASRLPSWAPGFADKVERLDENRWRVFKAEASFALRVAVDRPSGCVDYLREVAPGREGGAYLRVLPAPGGRGGVVVMTLPIPPGQDRAAVDGILATELEALVQRLAEIAG